MKIIKKRVIAGVLIMALTAAFGIVGTATEVKTKEDGTAMYRMYNPYTGEHLYTKNEGEKDYLISNNWNFEGYAWVSANEGMPVYRFFNEYSKEHHYTLDENEKAYLIDIGWNYEGIGWYSNNTGSECEVPVYRLFCPFTNEALKAHHYTMDKGERDWLLSIGWNDEGVCWNSMHNVTNGSIVEPTCVNTGYSNGATCKVCHKSYDVATLPINPNNHIHTSYVPESTMVIDRGTNFDRCAIYTCNICGEEIWRTGDREITRLDEWDSIVKHLNEKHGFHYHYGEDVKEWNDGVGTITEEEYNNEDKEQRQYWNQQIISGYYDTVVTPAHTYCNDCGKDVC